jgi:hypothetical protein
MFAKTYCIENLRRNWDVATVNDLSPGVERVRLEWDVVSATKSDSP